MRNPIVKSMDETIDAIVERRASISRYGDGEFDIIFGRTQGFQGLNYELGERLKRCWYIMGNLIDFWLLCLTVLGLWSILFLKLRYIGKSV